MYKTLQTQKRRVRGSGIIFNKNEQRLILAVSLSFTSSVFANSTLTLSSFSRLEVERL